MGPALSSVGGALLLLLVTAVRQTYAGSRVDCDALKDEFCSSDNCQLHPTVADACCDCHKLCCSDREARPTDPRSVRPPPGGCIDEAGTARKHGERWQDNTDHPCAWLSCDDGRISVDLNISHVCKGQPEGFDCVASRKPGHCCFEYFCNQTTTHSYWGSGPPPPESPRFFAPCLDADGQKHSHGTQWTSEDGCKGYSCANGKVTEVPIVCLEVAPHANCVPVPASGHCCPEFVCPPTLNDCVTETGEIYEDGAVWAGAQECIILQCSAGIIEKFPVSCPPPPSDPTCQRIDAPQLCCPFYACPTDGRCTDSSGVVRPDGAHWSSPNGCTHYDCMSGMIATGTVTCEPLPLGGICYEVPPPPGQCCPSYRCDIDGGGDGGGDDGGDDGGDGGGAGNDAGSDNQDCVDEDGVLRQHGDHWATANNCTRYTCHQGVVLGVSAVCLPPPPGSACVPETVPGFCCQLYRCAVVPPDGACRDENGVLRPNGSHWTSEDNCLQFTCASGQVLGLTELCVHVFLPGCVPQTVPGQCCPDYNCTSIGPRDCVRPDGSVLPHGSHVIDENRCLVISCTNGTLGEIVVECPLPPRPGCVPVEQPNSCCPTFFCPEPGQDCVDPNGVPLVHNSSRISADGCTIYTCFDGELSVTFEECIEPYPPGNCLPVFTPGVCCPSFNCSGPADCEDPNGQIRPHNSNWTSADGCTIYKCFDGVISSSNVVCDVIASPSPDCVSVNIPGQCCPVYDCPHYGTRDCTDPSGALRAHNSSWSSADGCTIYTCSDGAISSTTIKCPEPASYLCVPVNAPGQCCPTFVCPNDDAPQDCTDSTGTVRPHNSSWTSADSCTVYRCFNGTITGTSIRCVVPPDFTPDCLPVYTPGQCCPDFECPTSGDGQGCLTPDGRPVAHNTTMVSEDGCITYHCQSGFLAASTIDCARPPTDPDCVPVRTPGQCCPFYECPDTPNQDCTDSTGTVRPHNSSWTSADSCTVYRCFDGTITGTSIRCVKPPDFTPDCLPVYTPGQCCPDFQCPTSDDGQGCLTPDGRPVAHNTTMVSEDGCITYHCQSGFLAASTIDCARPPTDPACVPVRTPGQCCPFYECPDTPNQGCVDATGQLRPDGSHWASTNNCTRYMCEDSQVRGISFVCVPPPPSYGGCSEFNQPGRCCPRYICDTPPAAGACRDVDGVLRPNGSHWTSEDNCLHFTCENGQVLGLTTLCVHLFLPGCVPQTVPGQCCPDYNCTSTGQRDCVETDGSVQPHGTDVFDETGCIVTSCRDGTLHVAIVDCPPTPPPGCVPIAVPGQCCPDYNCTSTPPTGQACTDQNGNTRPHNSNWTTPDGCVRHCSNGVIFVIDVECSEPPRADCVAIQEPDRCCPTYKCPSSDTGCVDEGRYYQHGQTWLRANDCYYRHRCDYGVVTKTELVCQPPASSDCQVVTVPGLCCPVYDCSSSTSTTASTTTPLSTTTTTITTTTSATTTTTQASTTTVTTAGTSPVTPTTQPTAEVCEDEYGQVRPPGSFWTSADGCTNHACADGVVFSVREPCPSPPEDPSCIEVPGVCCPRYQCADQKPDPGCTDPSGVTHPVNQLYLDDPIRPTTCYVCASGSPPYPIHVLDVATDCPRAPAGCTEHFPPNRCCPEITCPGGVPCIFEGVAHAPGEEWTTDPPCASYVCVLGVSVQTNRTVCRPFPTTICSARHIPGQCCPVPDCPADSCTYAGQQHEHATTWPLDPLRPCTLLSCLNGTVISNDVSDSCPPPPPDSAGCTASTVPYRCCPVYDCVHVTCQYNDTTYGEGQEWLDDTTFPCKKFNCTRAGVNTVEDYGRECRPQPDGPCTGTRLPGTCCKQWLCPHCEVGGQQYPHGSTWWEDEKRHCTQMHCNSGVLELIEQHTECPPVPNGCTPLYRNNECCHYQYTCPECRYDPYGNPIKSLDNFLRRKRRSVARRRRERLAQARVSK
ncbi:kielin/chordin-like protein isoform X3 [Amphibalanus amphitrite]|uniref:kielin/chordin-like protein isoform X3 n=1 Tax=Amphibalanus amphitrite TaxID=1232801 RepID=UPI001C9113D5|nr:kielin/chordin-like protein isoform X3 [Amphibalanus amphitrite]